jgi:hypothetical protein
MSNWTLVVRLVRRRFVGGSSGTSLVRLYLSARFPVSLVFTVSGACDGHGGGDRGRCSGGGVGADANGIVFGSTRLVVRGGIAGIR